MKINFRKYAKAKYALPALGLLLLLGGGRPRRYVKKSDQVLFWLPEVRAAHSKFPDVSVPILLSIMHIESGGNQYAKNPRGAQGLMQFVKSARIQYKIPNPIANPRGAIVAGAHLLHDLMTRWGPKWGNQLKYIIAAYNRGPGTIDKTYPRIDATGLEYWNRFQDVYPQYRAYS